MDNPAAEYATRIVAAYVSHNPMASADVAAFYRTMYSAVANPTSGNTTLLSSPDRPPAVPIE